VQSSRPHIRWLESSTRSSPPSNPSWSQARTLTTHSNASAPCAGSTARPPLWVSASSQPTNRRVL
jgi:hypothetical protein